MLKLGGSEKLGYRVSADSARGFFVARKALSKTLFELSS